MDLLHTPDVTRLIEQAIHVAENHSKMDATIVGNPIGEVDRQA